jgi:glycosyltransferase involved in cell wall biosynthesis
MIKKILWISNGSTLNGAERCLLESATCLSSNANIVSKILIPEDGHLKNELIKEGIYDLENVSLPWWIDRGTNLNITEKLMLLLKILKSIFKLIVIVKRYKPDVIITNTIACPCGSIAAFLLRKKHIWYIHEFGKEDHGFDFVYGTKLSTKIIDKLSCIVILNSKSVYNKYYKLIDNKKIEILNCEVRVPIQTITLDNKNNKEFKILIAGRITESKGQLEAVNALIELNKKYNLFDKKIKLNILGSIGNEVYYENIKDIISKNLLNEYVEFLPFCENPFNIIASSNLLLMCSKNEAFGRITVEALKLGIPVIGAKIGGTLEIIKENKNGLFYELGNYKQLAERILELYKNEVLYKILSENAKRGANELYNNENHTNDLIKILNKL